MLSNFVASLVLSLFIKDIHLDNYINLVEMKDGDLVLSLTTEGKEFIEEKTDGSFEFNHDRLLHDLLEDFTCNGWHYIDPEYINVGLTSCDLILSNDIRYNEETEEEYFDPGDHIWHDNYYAIRSQVQALYENGNITLWKHIF